MRSERKRVLNDEGETSRLLTFCDGVFAIAITLLVLAIHVPLPTELGKKSLLDLLGEQWPIYMSYMASFLLIGIFWINHHRVCRYIKRADRLLLAINLILLMCIAVIPFPTDMMGLYINRPESKTVALIYGGTVFVTMVMFDLMWWYARQNDLVDKGLAVHRRQGMARSYLVGTLVYLAAVGLSLVNSKIALILYILVPALYILTPPFEHLLAKARHTTAEQVE